jgi:drug/metabolite transporter (DMT)-like permease
MNLLFYLLPTLIWGSTWLAITFQLGVVPPELSVAYRFSLAAVLLFLFTWSRKLTLRFDLRQHVFMALQGVLLFSLNYLLVYLAEQYLSSGMVAMVFSTIVIGNVIFGALFLKIKVKMRVLAGAMFGIAGISVVFYPELAGFDLSVGNGLGLVFALGSVLSASLGNIVSAYNQRSGLPVIQTNAYGMAYGAVFMLLIVLINGTPLVFDVSAPYIRSLIYLALFGSMVAFGAYLTLLGRIGPDRAAYIMVIFPVIALGLSTVFEGMTWTPSQLLGVSLVLLGNLLVLWRRSKAPGDSVQPAAD